MCNPECIRFVERTVGIDDIAGKAILEVGAYDVNGSARPYLETLGPASYIGVDLVEGPGVDKVCDAEDLLQQFGPEAFDVVLSTEMIEHVKDWRKIITNLKCVVRPGGKIILTTRSRGFPLHDFPHDYWRFQLEDMRIIFADCIIEALDVDPIAPGVYIAARRPASPSFEPLDLSGYALYSIHSDCRMLEAGSCEVQADLQGRERATILDVTAANQGSLDFELDRQRLVEDVRRLRSELNALRSTRTFRYSALPRRSYGWMRRLSRCVSSQRRRS